jgi:hypothetical protein
MKREYIALILKAPLVLIVIGSFAGAIYAAQNNIQGITYETPAILGGILVSYFLGAHLSKKKRETKEKHKEEKPIEKPSEEKTHPEKKEEDLTEKSE